MRRIRIHNDITLRWHLFNGQVPLNVSSYIDREVYLCLPYKLIPADYSVDGNTITITFQGKDQCIAGIYGLLLVINKGKAGMITVDCKDVFELVRSSMFIGGEDGEVDVETVNCRSNAGTDIIARLVDLLDVDGSDGKVEGSANGRVLTYIDGTWKAMNPPDSFNLDMMWDELRRNDGSFVIDASHIPSLPTPSDEWTKLFVPHYNQYGALESIEAKANFWTNGSVTAKGRGQGGGGGGGVDMARVWEALREPTSEQINESHLSFLSNYALKKDYLPLQGGNLSGNLTLPGLYFKDSGHWSVSEQGNLYYNDGTRTMMVFDSSANAVRQISGGSTKLGTSAIPWSDLYSKNAYFSDYIRLSGTTNTKRRIYFGDSAFIELDEDGYFHFSKGLYSDSFISAKGKGSGGSGGGGIDLARVWEALRGETNEQINAAHLANAFATLAAVARTGNYSDLIGKPTLATVATSGSYNDLTNKPSLDFLPIAGGELTGWLKIKDKLELTGTTKEKRRIYFDATHFIELDDDGMFHFSHGLYSEGAVSAKGKGTGGGSHVSGLTWADLGTNADTKIISKDHLPTEFGNPSRNKVIAYSVQIHNDTIPGEVNTSASGTLVKSTFCAMFPDDYDPKGKPSPVVALLHGGGGHCTTNFMGYSDDNTNGWSNFKTKLLGEGYVIFDINGYGSYAANVETANHYGCPRSVETMKKAFEYLKENYNVEHRLSIVAVSMGGALLMSYAMNYPADVIACASLAPISLQYSMSSAAYTPGDMTSSRNRCAAAFGYADYEAMAADNMSNAIGFSPVMAATRYTSNGAMIPNMDWSMYTYRKTYPDPSSATYQEVKARIDYCYGFNFSYHLPVPVRIWHGDADTVNGIGMSRDTITMLRNGGSNATLRVCPGLGHPEVHGKTQYVVNEVADWLKRIR